MDLHYALAQTFLSYWTYWGSILKKAMDWDSVDLGSGLSPATRHCVASPLWSSVLHLHMDAMIYDGTSGP